MNFSLMSNLRLPDLLNICMSFGECLTLFSPKPKPLFSIDVVASSSIDEDRFSV